MSKLNKVLMGILLLTTGYNLFSQSITTNPHSLRVVDYENRTVLLPREVQRIVPLVPSALRILVQVGAADKIVAIDRKSAAAKATMLPLIARPVLATLPVVGDRKEPNLEAILRLSPDLVITSTTSDKADALQKALGVPVICVVSEADEDYKIIKLLGTVSGRQTRAEQIVQYLENAADILEAKISSVPPGARKRVYLGLFTNTGKFTQTMPVYQSLKLAGGINVAADVPATTTWGTVEINKERILAWNPDVVFIDWRESSSYLAKETFLGDMDFASLTAVRTGRIHYSQTSHDGKDYAAALAEAYYMASILYPELVPHTYAIEAAEQAYRTLYDLSGYYTSWIESFGIR